MSDLATPALELASLDRSELAELRATVREAASEAGYPERVRELEGSDTGIDTDLWTLLAEEIGLAGVGLPESAGGLGGLAEILAVTEELGATLAPVPFLSSTVLAGQLLSAAGAGDYLERIAGGQIAGPAVTDDRGRPGTSVVSDGATVTGTVRFVPFGASAAFFVVAAQCEGSVELFAVEADAGQVEPLTSFDFSRPSATVTFAGSPAVRLTHGNGEVALQHGIDVALLATGADQLGGAQYCFDMTLEYIKMRRQFNREIGSFQAIKHRMADALMLVEMARSGLERATWEASEQFSADAAVVKAWGSESYMAMAAEAIQLHGGVGFTWEHDAHLYFRRARYDNAFLGDATYQRERIAELQAW